MKDLRLTRRRLLFSAGSGVLGISVVNTVSGCSTSSDQAGSGGSTPPAANGGQSNPAGQQSSSGPPGGASDGAVVVGDWRRVDLSFVSAYLLIRRGEVAVVDLGTKGSGAAIEAGLTAAGTGWDAVKHIILTHKHPDHAGGLEDVASKISAKLYAGQADLAGITSKTALTAIKDGDDVFGLQIIGTPGHTAGHMSVFDPATGVLVAGDALRATAGLASSDPKYTADPAAAAASVRKLAALDVRAILPGHGAPLTTNAAEALKSLAASL